MSNQYKFRRLLMSGGVAQGEAASLIAEETKRPCSVRSVRAWLAAPAGRDELARSDA